MHIRHCLLAATTILLAGVLVACGTPDDLQSTDRAPGRSELIARLQSPSEADDLHSFRIKTELSITGQFTSPDDAAAAGAGTMAMQADVQTEPAAMHLTTTFAEETGRASSLSQQTIVIGERLWLNRGDRWYEEETDATDLTDRLFDVFAQFTNPIASFAEAPETSDLLQAAEIVGVEEVNGYRTTHFQITTETMLALMMEAYGNSASIGPACSDLKESDDGPRDLRDGEAMARFFQCMGSAVAGELPPPDEYIERYEIDLWVSDDGLVMREQSVMTFAFLPLAAVFDSSDDAPVTISTTFDLYDLNVELEISPPEVD